MPRKPRTLRGNTAYHVLNRATARATIFQKPADYAAFERTLEQAHARFPLRILAYVLMPRTEKGSEDGKGVGSHF